MVSSDYIVKILDIDDVTKFGHFRAQCLISGYCSRMYTSLLVVNYLDFSC